MKDHVPTLEEVDRWLTDAPEVAIDTEFDMDLPVSDPEKLWGVSLAVPGGEFGYLPVRSTVLSCNGLPSYPLDKIRECLSPHMRNKEKLWIGHNIGKCDAPLLSDLKFPIVFPRCRDTMLADWVTDENNPQHGLKPVTWREFKYKMGSWAESVQAGRFSKEFYKYGATDAKYTGKLWWDKGKLRDRLEEQGLMKLLVTMEMPVAWIVKEMETEGMPLDGAILAEDLPKIEKEMAQLQQAIYDLNDGVEFKLSNPAFLAEFVYTKMGHPVYTMTDGGKKSKPRPSTKEVVLKGLMAMGHQRGVDEVLQWKKLNSLVTKFYGPYMAMLGMTHGRVHCQFNQTGTVTGRFCVAADTKLDTSIGTFCISELPLTKGQRVSILTHEGRRRRVLGKSFKGYERMFKVTLDDGSSITCTRNHRLLTPGGWRSLHELEVGDVVQTPDREAPCWLQGEEECPGEGRLRDGPSPEHTGCGGSAKVQGGRGDETRMVHDEGGVPRGVLGAYRGAASKEAILLGTREHERVSTALDFDPPREAPASRRGRKEGRGHSGGAWYVGTLCAESYSVPWACQDGRASEPDAEDRFADPSGDGLSSSRLSRGLEGILRRPWGVLREALRGLWKAFSAFMVRAVPLNGVLALQGDKAATQESYLLEQEPRRAYAFAGPSLRGCSAHSSVLLLQEVHGGLCVAREEASRGGRWGVPRGLRADEADGQEKAKGCGSSRVHGYSVLHEGSPGRPEGRCGLYQECAIRSIDDAGVQAVWDIEVEEDHSYLAGGMIHHNSSSSPNLQQIPRTTKKASPRRAFKAPEGRMLIDADFSQIELRLAAHLSEDPTLMEAYIAEHGDIHARTAEACGVGRQDAKPINFGFLYRMGARTFQANVLKDTGILLPMRDCERFKRTYFRLYPGLKRYHHKVEALVKKYGWVKTLFGRRRRLEGMMKHAEYGAVTQAINFTIQGTAGDMLKLSMRNYEQKRYERAKEQSWWKEVKFVCQVHDELILEAPEEHAQEAADELRKTMESVAVLKVPLIAEAKVGRTWDVVH